ncbi:unnamed protein product [Cylicocyclus nassatus]|uniref:Uncharacterized protein n=1 Tax=Cylicocyclus nassatus TaxID=53992 RepID=A0AA36DUT7_CYLNA|nr:unnamed protein product [Cylicocyclus nassatus]
MTEEESVSRGNIEEFLCFTSFQICDFGFARVTDPQTDHAGFLIEYHKVVSSPRNHAELKRLHKVHRRVLAGLHSCRNVESSALPRQTLPQSVELHPRYGLLVAILGSYLTIHCRLSELDHDSEFYR